MYSVFRRARLFSADWKKITSSSFLQKKYPWGVGLSRIVNGLPLVIISGDFF